MKKIAFFLGAISMLITVNSTALAFGIRFQDVDVTQSDKWYYSYVAKVSDDGLMLGVSDTTFAPNASMTREQSVTVLARFAGAELPQDSASDFTDVKAGQWYTPYIAWAQKKSIVKGTSDKTFGIGQTVTREQMAVMLSDYIHAADDLALAKVENPIAAFQDSDDVSDWAKKAVEEMRIYGIFEGDEAGRFLPKKAMTRAEAAKALVSIQMANTNDYKIDFSFDKVTAITLSTFVEEWKITDQKTIQEILDTVNAAPISAKRFLPPYYGNSYKLIVWNGTEEVAHVGIQKEAIEFYHQGNYSVKYLTESDRFQTVVEKIQAATESVKK